MSTPQETEPQMMAVFLTVGIRTSRGPGPGPKRLPAAEAALLISRRHAVAGDQPPRGFTGTAEPAVRVFDDNHRGSNRFSDDGLRH